LLLLVALVVPLRTSVPWRNWTVLEGRRLLALLLLVLLLLVS
jgi:hypothetical protein